MHVDCLTSVSVIPKDFSGNLTHKVIGILPTSLSSSLVEEIILHSQFKYQANCCHVYPFSRNFKEAYICKITKIVCIFIFRENVSNIERIPHECLIGIISGHTVCFCLFSAFVRRTIRLNSKVHKVHIIFISKSLSNPRNRLEYQTISKSYTFKILHLLLATK